MHFRDEYPTLYRLLVGLLVSAVIFAAGNGLLCLYHDELIALRDGEKLLRALKLLASAIPIAWFVIYVFKLRTY